MLVRGLSRLRVGAPSAPAPQVEVYPTQYGDITQVVTCPKVYEMIQALGYRHLGDLYTLDNQIVEERALKERAPTRKGILGLRAWLARHSAVLVPLLRAPMPRWQAAPKEWILGVVPAYSTEAVVGGRAAKATKEETVYHKGYALKVSTAMKANMEAECWAPGVLPAPGCGPQRHPVALPPGGRAGSTGAGEWTAARRAVGRPPARVLGSSPGYRGACAHHRLASRAANNSPPAVGANVARPPGRGDYFGAAVAMDCRSTSPVAKYPTVCVTLKCPGHPYKGPLYYSLHTVGVLPAELQPALKTHLHENHQVLALLAPHGLATDPPPPIHPGRGP